MAKIIKFPQRFGIQPLGCPGSRCTRCDLRLSTGDTNTYALAGAMRDPARMWISGSKAGPTSAPEMELVSPAVSAPG